MFPGDRVLVEAVVVDDTFPDKPYSILQLRIPEASDPDGLSDGVNFIAPKHVIHPDPRDHAGLEARLNAALDAITSEEAFYADQD